MNCIILLMALATNDPTVVINSTHDGQPLASQEVCVKSMLKEVCSL